jgi:hypothetical protein
MTKLTKFLTCAAVFGISYAYQVHSTEPTPTLSDFTHSVEMAGVFKYHPSGKGSGGTTIGRENFWCHEYSGDVNSCESMSSVPSGTFVTGQFYKFSRRHDGRYVLLATSIVANSREIFHKTPEEYMTEWPTKEVGNRIIVSSCLTIFTFLIVAFPRQSTYGRLRSD